MQRYGEWKLFVNDSMTSKKTVKLDGSRVRTDGSAAPSSLTLNPLQGVVLQKK